jgi:hypothetical protein
MTKMEAKKANDIIRNTEYLNMLIKIMKTNRGDALIEKLKDAFVFLDMIDTSILYDWAEMSVEFFNDKIKEKEEELKNM